MVLILELTVVLGLTAVLNIRISNIPWTYLGRVIQDKNGDNIVHYLLAVYT